MSVRVETYKPQFKLTQVIRDNEPNKAEWTLTCVTKQGNIQLGVPQTTSASVKGIDVIGIFLDLYWKKETDITT
jgi:hypothetical protein